MPRPGAILLPPDTVRTIDDLAMRGWPARLVQPLNGWHRLYLQVEQDNAVAQRLYRRAGFSFAYSYRYRTR